MRKRSTPEPARRRYASIWTTSRATATGFAAGLVAIIVSLTSWELRENLFLLWLAAVALTAFCGVSILWITLLDMVSNPRRGAKVAPLRGFDIAVGLLLAVPSLWALSGLLE